LALPTQPKWKEIRRGLRFVVAGHLFLFLFIASQAAILLMAWGWLRLPGLSLEEKDGLEAICQLVGAIGFVFGGVLTLIGQWLCLRCAPQDHSAKELAFTSVLAGMIAVPLACAAPFLDDLWNGRALEGFLDALHYLEVPSVISVLLGAFFALTLVNLLAFSQFARVVAGRFKNEMLNQVVSYLYLYVCVLMGGSAGAFAAFRQFPSQTVLLGGVALGWFFCLPWHTFAVLSAQRVVGRGLRPTPAEGPRSDGGSTKPYSGLHRVYKSPWASTP
jgi:hypothetical protein